MVDPDLHIRAGGAGGGHPDPEIRRGGRSPGGAHFGRKINEGAGPPGASPEGVNGVNRLATKGEKYY